MEVLTMDNEYIERLLKSLKITEFKMNTLLKILYFIVNDKNLPNGLLSKIENAIEGLESCERTMMKMTFEELVNDGSSKNTVN
jgi:hypothetical protein